MLSTLLVAVFVGLVSGGYVSNLPDAQNDPESFILYDVSVHKGSAGGDLKTAFNSLKNVVYAFKVIGEDRALFIAENRDDCDTFQTDFHGLQVDAKPLVSPGNQTVEPFNQTGLVVMELITTIDNAQIDEVFAAAAEECGNCFIVYVQPGYRPQVCIVVGNIPLDLATQIATNVTSSNDVRDRASTELVVDFNLYANKHATGCIDLHATHPIQPIKDVHKPIPIHAFPGKSAAHEAPHVPIHNTFPKNQIDDPHFNAVNFPNINKGGYSDTRPSFDSGHFNFDPHAQQSSFF